MLRALQFDRAHRPEHVEGRLSKDNPQSFPPRLPWSETCTIQTARPAFDRIRTY